MRVKSWAWWTSVLALSAILLAVPSVAMANGVPVKLVLGYQNTISNWGPKGAVGVADVAIGEGIVHVIATGLPQLSGQVYEGWLINSRTGDKFSTGRFNADADGSVDNQRGGDPIPDKHWDMFLLSVVGQDQSTTEPTAQISIAGYYPVLKLADPAERPDELPYTGGELGVLPLLVALAVGGVLGFGIRSVLPRGGARR